MTGETTTAPKPQPVDPNLPKAWMPPANSNLQAYYRQGDKTVILNTSTVYLDGTFNFETPALMIYAETIKLQAALISLPGKTLGLFCNRLELTGDATTIDVSGKAGEQLPDNGQTVKGKQGGDGGNIIVSVEEFSDQLLNILDVTSKKGLFLIAKGGQGGKGSSTSNKPGGEGGDGGKGGNITFYFGHQANNERYRLESIGSSDTTWRAKSSILRQYNLGFTVPKVWSDGFNNILNPLKAALELQNQFFDTIDKVSGVESPFVADSSFTSALQAVQNTVNTANLSKKAPTLSKSLSAKLLANMTGLLDSGKTNADRVKFAQGLNDILTSVYSSSTQSGTGDDALMDVNLALDNYIKGCKATPERMLALIFNAYRAQCPKGQPGPGGSNPNQSTAANGKDGQVDGTCDIQPLRLSDSVADLGIKQVLANPNECQMLLNRAYDLYFQAFFESDFRVATSYYERACEFYLRISKRLRFVQPLIAAVASARAATPTTPPAPKPIFEDLSAAYGRLEQEQFAVAPLSQLSSIKRDADRALGYLASGLDMFGHDTSWVPRLSFLYYKARADPMIQRMHENEMFIQSLSDGRDNTIRDFQKNATIHQYECRAQITTLTDPKGPLEVAAAQIKSVTPLLKEKRAAMKQSIESVQEKIRKVINTDPKIFIDAFSMLAMGPNKANAAAQGLSAGYTAFTTVHAADGTNVDQTYVVSQFGEAGDTFQKLEEGYKNRMDATIDVDDPGATKLTASVDKINELVTKFKDALGDATQDAIRMQLDEYIAIVKQRNDAVLSYNAAVKLLLQARENEAFYAGQAQQLGQQSLKLDSNRPALEFLSIKSINDLRLLCQQTLIFGEKALNYWGLLDLKKTQVIKAADDSKNEAKRNLGDETAAQIAVSLVPNSIAFEAKVDDLLKKFQSCLARYADNPGVVFPDRQNDATKSLGGIKYWLSDASIKTLKQKRYVRAIPSGSQPTTADEKTHFYRCDFEIKASDPASSVDENVFAGLSDVRIDAIRVWLFGVAVGSNALEGTSSITAQLQHWGNDTIVDPSGKQFAFSHDHVLVPFKYDPTGLNKWSDVASARIYSEQKLPHVSWISAMDIATDSMAPFGPFTSWRLVVKANQNSKLDLGKVNNVCVEFWGSAKPFNDSTEFGDG